MDLYDVVCFIFILCLQVLFCSFSFLPSSYRIEPTRIPINVYLLLIVSLFISVYLYSTTLRTFGICIFHGGVVVCAHNLLYLRTRKLYKNGKGRGSFGSFGVPNLFYEINENVEYIPINTSYYFVLGMFFLLSL